MEELKVLLDVDISSGKSGSGGTLHLENSNRYYAIYGIIAIGIFFIEGFFQSLVYTK